MQEHQIWKILLIDDDEDDYLITREMLTEAKGARVRLTWASTYTAGREQLFGSQTFDAVLVDYDLGLHTGLELIREATVQESSPPIILLTGRGSYEVDVEAMQAGASLYLTKNEVNPLLLERSIRYAMDRKRSERELMQANVALRESEDRFRQLVSVMPAAMYTCDSEGRLTFYNQRAVEIWGFEPPLNDIEYRYCGGNRLFSEDGTPLPHDETPMARAVHEGLSTRDAEVQLERPDGTMLTVSVNIDPLYDAAGCITGAVNVFVDVTERKRVEEMLRAQKHELQTQKRELEVKNQQLEGLFSHAPAALALFLAQPPYMVLAHNQVYQQMWNEPHRSEGLVGKYIPDYIPEAEENGILDIFAEVARSGKGRTVYQFPYEGLDSGPEWWNWNLSPVFSEGKLVAFAHLLVDVTEEATSQVQMLNAQQQMLAELEERRRTEETLKFALSRLQGLVESNVVGITISDKQGRVLEANDYFLNLVGSNREELEAGQVRWGAITPPEYLARDNKALVELNEKGIITPFEKEYQRKDGSRVWVLVSISTLTNEPEHMVAFIVNIADRKQAELAYLRSQEALVQSEARFRVLADSMPQLVWMAAPDGKVIYYNRRSAEYHGIQAIGDAWEWSPVVHEDDLESTIAAWNNALKTGTMYQAEHRVRMRDGEYRWHLSRGVPMLDENGKVIQWYGTATDIHEQKQIEAALRQREAQLEMLVKSVESSNRDLERFAFVASHDLQEPLRKVRAFAERLNLALKGRLHEEEQNYLDRMQTATARMQGMVDDLLQLSRVSASKRDFGPVDLNSVARDVLSDLRPRMDRAGARVSFGPLPTIHGDRVLMRQLFLHLVDNAIKFNREDTTPEVRVWAETEPGAVRLIVEDNGIGFDPAYTERIFQPFSRLHGQGTYEGSGMGLAICRKIVERHQGQITASGLPGEGSRFEITLPTIHVGL